MGAIDARFLTEGAIRAALVDAFAAAVAGDEIRLATPALGDRSLITAMLKAVARGARVRVLLDADAPPNPAVAGELMRASTRRHRGALVARRGRSARPCPSSGIEGSCG